MGLFSPGVTKILTFPCIISRIVRVTSGLSVGESREAILLEGVQVYRVLAGPGGRGVAGGVGES